MSDAERPLRILHLSDTHISAAGVLMYDAVDTRLALGRVLAHADPLEVDAVVASGDLSDDGSVEAYEHLASVVGGWAVSHGAPVVWAMGNHDLADGFERVLGDRRSVTRVAGRRILVVDSSVPGRGHGEVGQEQLDALGRTLAEPSEAGDVVVVHHPPLPAATALLAALELQDAGALMAVLADGDVRAVLSGHYHLPMVGPAGGIPVVVAPGVANTADVTGDADHERAHAGSGYAIVEVPVDRPARAVFVHVPGPQAASAGDPLEGTRLFELDAAGIAAIAREAGPA